MRNLNFTYYSQGILEVGGLTKVFDVAKEGGRLDTFR